jgi:hypothetical protein
MKMVREALKKRRQWSRSMVWDGGWTRAGKQRTAQSKTGWMTSDDRTDDLSSSRR